MPLQNPKDFPSSRSIRSMEVMIFFLKTDIRPHKIQYYYHEFNTNGGVIMLMPNAMEKFVSGSCCRTEIGHL